MAVDHRRMWPRPQWLQLYSMFSGLRAHSLVRKAARRMMPSVRLKMEGSSAQASGSAKRVSSNPWSSTWQPTQFSIGAPALVDWGAANGHDPG